MPTELRAWDLQRLVDDGLGVQDVPYYNTVAFTPVGNKVGVRDCIARNVYDLVERLSVDLTLGPTGAGGGFDYLEFRFNVTIMPNRRLPVEVKADWVLEDLGHQAIEQFFNSHENRNNSHLCCACCQLNEYLAMNDGCYGLLFTYSQQSMVCPRCRPPCSRSSTACLE